MSHDPLAWIDDELQRLAGRGLWRQRVLRVGPQGPVIELDGRRLVNFGSNDYLGLAAELSAAAPQADAMSAGGAPGWGSGASPLITGWDAAHEQLERELSRFEGTEASLLFSSGYAANVGTLAALVGKADAVYSDARNHASIIDGCRLSGAQIVVYPHGDAAALARLLGEGRRFRRRLIVTDSLFSMDGDLAPLPALAEVAARHKAMLMVDEAHATGVFGSRGRGVCEHLGMEDAVHVRVGTLSKALGSIGGFVTGRRSLVDWLANRARPYFFSTAPPAAFAYAALDALAKVRQEPQRRQRLLSEAAALRSELAAQGWQTGGSASQIIPLVIGDPHQTMQAAAHLREAGLLVPGIRPPSVPVGHALLRISLSAAHQPAHCEQLLTATAALRR